MYRQFECLWDKKNEFYSNKDARESTLKHIAQQMDIDGFGVEEAKTKIRSLRSTYMGEIAKIKKSKSNPATTRVYQPNLKWFPILEPIMASRYVKTKTHDPELTSDVQNAVKSEVNTFNLVSPGCSTSKKIKLHEGNEDELLNMAVQIMTKPPDDAQTFGNFVASSIKNLRSEANRRKLKRKIQSVILEIEELDDVYE
ncbi:uncharacterized protein LOC143911254 isoform X2 [Arctopsyche grandis]